MPQMPPSPSLDPEEPLAADPLSPHAMPHLEPEGLAAFERHVAATPCYVEYGAGASTLHAMRMGARHVVSVDSSRPWLDAVHRQLPRGGNYQLMHCNIGEVGDWGRPLDDRGLRAYHAYMSAPWKIVREKSLDARFVFIDGRFRVACFLYSLICAPEGATILFDDYMDRPAYHVVEQFCARRGNFGRMALFQVDRNDALPDLVSRIAQYSIIPD